MKILSILLFVLFVATGCQSQKSLSPYASRSLASTPAFTRFLEKLASGSSKKYTAQKLEREILEYLRTKPSGKQHGNWKYAGLSEDEAKMIESLDDNHVYMPKVRKWVAENVTRIFPSIQRNIASDAYDIFMQGRRFYTNPYKVSGSVAAHSSSRRRNIRPERNIIPDSRVRLLQEIQRAPSNYQKIYKEALSEFIQRGKGNPSFRQNGIVIVESANEVTRVTGLSGMGTGCPSFTKSAPERIIASKANVDSLRRDLVITRAEAKYGKAIEVYTKVPKGQRLTQSELDDVTIDSLKRIQGLTDQEARIAYRRLKSKPCKVY